MGSAREAKMDFLEEVNQGVSAKGQERVSQESGATRDRLGTGPSLSPAPRLCKHWGPEMTLAEGWVWCTGGQSP